MQSTSISKRSVHHAARVRELFQRSNGAAQSNALFAQALDEMAMLLEALQATEDELALAQERQLDGYALLQAEHQTYFDLFTHAPFAYLTSRLDGAIRRANQAAQCLLHNPPNLIGQSLAHLIPSEQRRAFERLLQRLSAAPGAEQLTTTLHLPDHAPMPITLEGQTACSSTGRPQELRWVLHVPASHAAQPTRPDALTDQQTRQRVHFLAEASLLLRAHTNWTAACLQLAHLATSAFAACVVLHRVTAGETERIIGVNAAAPGEGETRIVRQLHESVAGAPERLPNYFHVPGSSLNVADLATLNMFGLPEEVVRWIEPMLPLHGYATGITHSAKQQWGIMCLQSAAQPGYTVDQQAMLDELVQQADHLTG